MEKHPLAETHLIFPDLRKSKSWFALSMLRQTLWNCRRRPTKLCLIGNLKKNFSSNILSGYNCQQTEGLKKLDGLYIALAR